MVVSRNDIILKLQSDILRLQGFKQERGSSSLNSGLGSLVNAFPNSTFPTGCIHEFLSDSKESSAATTAFIGGLVNMLTGTSGVTVWISSGRKLFPPALANFGLHPERFIFIDLKKERDLLWAMDEALKCEALTAVIGEIDAVTFTESRRLQLAVEQSNVTGFLIRNTVRNKVATSACVSRWRITSLPGERLDDLPGIGFPKWQVELLRIRNGKPGTWEVSWRQGGFDIQRLQETPHDIREHRMLG